MKIFLFLICFSLLLGCGKKSNPKFQGSINQEIKIKL
jgi:hypothetical protein